MSSQDLPFIAGGPQRTPGRVKTDKAGATGPQDGRVQISSGVFVRESCGRCSVFTVRTGRIYGLDETATRMLVCVLKAESIRTAYELLSQEFEVAPDVLWNDFLALIARLREDRIIQIAS